MERSSIVLTKSRSRRREFMDPENRSMIAAACGVDRRQLNVVTLEDHGASLDSFNDVFSLEE